MSTHLKVFLFTIITLATSCQVRACGMEEWRDQTRALDQKYAQEFLTDFLVLCAQDPLNLYSLPLDESHQFPEIEVKNLSIKKEQYQLINLWQEEKSLSMWVFLPLSTYDSFKQCQEIVSKNASQMRLEINGSTGKSSFFYQLKTRVKAALHPFMQGWMAQDNFTSYINIGGQGHELDMFSLYNPDLCKVIFAGVTFEKPKWVDQDFFADDEVSEGLLSVENNSNYDLNESSSIESIGDDSYDSTGSDFSPSTSPEISLNQKKGGYEGMELNFYTVDLLLYKKVNF